MHFLHIFNYYISNQKTLKKSKKYIIFKQSIKKHWFMTVYAYLRVSTDQQDTDNQKHGIIQYAKSNNLQKLQYIEDTASGAKHWKDRQLGELLEKATAGDLILFAEVSRIGRSTLQVLEFLQTAADRKVIIHIAKQQMIFDNSLNSRIIATTLALAAEIEREFISARTREALAKRKAAGHTLGRPKGSTNKKHKLDPHQKEIIQLLENKVSKAAIARIFSVSRNTVSDYIKLKNLDGKHATKPTFREHGNQIWLTDED